MIPEILGIRCEDGHEKLCPHQNIGNIKKPLWGARHHSPLKFRIHYMINNKRFSSSFVTEIHYLVRLHGLQDYFYNCAVFRFLRPEPDEYTEKSKF